MEPLNQDLRIQGAKVNLRPITEDDTENLLKWRNDPNVVDNFIYRKVVTRQEHERWLATKVFTGKVHQFIITVNETGKDIGSIYLQNFDEENKKTEWGIFIGSDSEVYGKGYGTEAATLIWQYAFKDLGYHKVMSRVLAYNTASIRMNEKAGYKKEALLVDELLIDGKYEDVILFGIINEDGKV